MEYLAAYQAVCQKDGIWDSPMPTCRPVNCGSPDEILNGKVSVTTTTYQSLIQYTCNAPFYIIKGSAKGTYICDHKGYWIDSFGKDNPPECVPACGKPKSGKLARIVGGIAVAKKEIPWQALVKGYGDVSNLEVRMGVVLRNDTDAVVGEPEAVFLHPKYRHDGVNFDHDIALIRLRRRVPVSAAVMPVCLPQTDERFLLRTDDLGLVSGWGVWRVSRRRASRQLRYAELPVVDFESCRDAYGALRADDGRPLVVTENMICAGLPEGGRDACEGDSGGPFVFYDDVSKAWFIGGIVSWGYECAKPGLYGVYTKVSSYIPWIDAIIESHR
ncbi:hypothetical protein AAFF_G00233450 [Aldrovandia affinis]|uniref:Vitamin K-dependent protein C n=1 Tax=Aldrovandia affinis TaxID=143900 RepID=A0AAD7RF42_9TELE|nr:hypothetical protein AAFF_G00233450 [Aldrovandia affinis]